MPFINNKCRYFINRISTGNDNLNRKHIDLEVINTGVFDREIVNVKGKYTALSVLFISKGVKSHSDSFRKKEQLYYVAILNKPYHHVVFK